MQPRYLSKPPAEPPRDVMPFQRNSGHNGFLQRPESIEPEGSPPLTAVRSVTRHKGAILIGACIGILGGVMWTLPQRPAYMATASIEIQTVNDDFLNLKSSSSSRDSETSSETYLQTQIRILQSDSLVERVVQRLKVADWPEYQPGAGRLARLKQALGFPAPARTESVQRLIRRVAAHRRVRASGLTRVIEVGFDSADPQHAADFANALVAEFIESSRVERWKATQDAGFWLNRQLGEMKARIERSDEQLQAYARNEGLMFHADKESVAEEKLSQLQANLSRAQGEMAGKQAEYDIARSGVDAGSLPQVLNDVTLAGYQSKLTDLRRQYAELNSDLTAENPRVQRVQAQIDEVEESAKKQRAAILNRITNEYEEAKSRVNTLKNQYEAQTHAVADQAEKSVRYYTLKQEVESSRQLYDTMLQRVKEADIASALRTSNIRVVDPASRPSDPFTPNLPMNAGVGLLLGLVGTIALVLTRDQFHETIRTPGDPRSFLNLPELGAIPAGKVKPSTSLIAVNSNTSMMAEFFRASLATILFTLDRMGTSQLLTVTSPNPGDGKSMVSMNLALALAGAGRRVLLFDGDLRKPSLHKFFDTTGKPTLTQLLSGPGPTDGMVFHQILADPNIANLSVLASPSVVGSAINLLYSERFAQLMTQFRMEYDVVLIDTPPVLSLPDARILSRHADGVILVVRAGRTTREAALSATQQFEVDGTPILGTILNSWTQSKEYHTAYRARGMR